jgi:hypothetical protein
MHQKSPRAHGGLDGKANFNPASGGLVDVAPKMVSGRDGSSVV